MKKKPKKNKNMDFVIWGWANAPSTMNSSLEYLMQMAWEAGYARGRLNQEDAWSYNFYRASLRLNEKPFAIVTPDGRNALDKDDAEKLVNTLNKGSMV